MATLTLKSRMRHVDVDTARIGGAGILTIVLSALKLFLDNINAALAFLALAGAGAGGLYTLIRVYKSIKRDRQSAILSHQCPRLDFLSVSFKTASFEKTEALKARLIGLVEWKYIRFIEECGTDDGLFVYDICYDHEGFRKKPRRMTARFDDPLPLACFELISPPPPKNESER